MLERNVEVMIPEGLHARPATLFVQTAGKFSAHIEVGRDDKFTDAKSILGLMSLAVSRGQRVILRAQGDDAEQALDALEKILVEGV